MNLSDTIELKKAEIITDEMLNEVETTKWVSLGKCIIMPNTSAKHIRGNDGSIFIYSYEILFKKAKSYYYSTLELIPRANDEIHIVKADGSIDQVCKVSGFVTMGNWVKVWV